MANKLPAKTDKHSGNYCVAHGCNNSGRSGVGIYKFPKDLERRRQWVLQVQRTRVDFVDPKTTAVCLCGEHFTEDQFDSSIDRKIEMGFRDKKRGRVLLPTAIPTKFHRPANLPGLCSAQTPRRTSAIKKREHHKVVQELLLQSDSDSVSTVNTSTCKTDSEAASDFSETQPAIDIESCLEISLQITEKEWTFSKPSMQDFSCQFSGADMENFSWQVPGSETKDFSCQFPEDGHFLSEQNQFRRISSFGSQLLTSSFGHERLFDEDQDFEPQDESLDFFSDASAFEGRSRVPLPLCSLYRHPDKRKAVEEKIDRFKKQKLNNLK